MRFDYFLHEQSDFDKFIQAVSGEHAIAAQLIEKDYWIMHCLYGLTAQKFSFKLKGGPSLSRATTLSTVFQRIFIFRSIRLR